MLDRDNNVHARRSGLSITNSLCWSPNGEKLYHADSPSREIYQYSCDTSTGELTNPVLFAKTPKNVFPDGAYVDKNGHLWSAQWGGNCVVQYSANGEIMQRIELPVSQVSCVTIGGINLDQLFVTSARDGLTQKALEAEPLAGCLFIVNLAESIGLPEPI